MAINAQETQRLRSENFNLRNDLDNANAGNEFLSDAILRFIESQSKSGEAAKLAFLDLVEIGERIKDRRARLIQDEIDNGEM